MFPIQIQTQRLSKGAAALLSRPSSARAIRRSAVKHTQQIQLQQHLHSSVSLSVSATATAIGPGTGTGLSGLTGIHGRSQVRYFSSDVSSDKVVSPALHKANIEYCVDLVKKHDLENYLIGTLHVPRQFRASFFAIHSFNIEVALIRSQVRGNSAAARLRYKWWLDTLRNIYSNISNDINDSSSNAILNNPVLYCLYSSIKENDLSHRWLECVIEAKMNELNSIQHADLAELEDHCEKSHSSLLYLLLESMGIRHEQTEYMASHIGVCFGIVSHLRGTAYFLSQNITPFPAETMINCHLNNNFAKVLNQSGLNFEALSSDQDKAYRDVIFDISAQAFGHLDKARTLQDSIDNQAISVMLPGVICSTYLERLREYGFDPLHRDLLVPPHSVTAKIQLNMLKSLWTKTI